MTPITYDPIRLNKVIICLRRFFTESGFTEISLYSSSIYHVYVQQQTTTSHGLLLRTNTEPEIWKYGITLGLDRFYTIASLFRFEDTTSTHHLPEFKIVDFYVSGVTSAKLRMIGYQALQYLPSTSSSRL